jgi:hypothetical protein
MEVAVLNDNSGAGVRAYSFKDENHQEFIFPRSVIDASKAAGRDEVMLFRSRLEIAQRVVNRAPEFKTVFARQFQPVVFHVACLFIAAEALKVLIGKLAAADDVPLEDVTLACQRYPYLKVWPESSGKFAIELVEEAISVEGMALELTRKFGSLLEKLLSQDYAANWGMSHILAWAMNDCANQEHLRNQLLALPPDQADDAIWKRAWCGEESRGYFAQAVFHLASEIANSVLDTLDLNNRNIQEIETLIGLRNSAYYLVIAGDAARNSDPVLQWATTKYAGLSSSEALSIAETLREGGWRDLSDERSRRRFVHAGARKKSRDFDFIMLNGPGIPELPTYSPESWSRCGVEAFKAGRESIVAKDDPDFSAVPHTFDISAELDAKISLQRAIIAADLSLDAQRVLSARIEGHTREYAHEALGISKERVAAGWRELNRKKATFKKFLSPFPPPNCTLQ